MVVEKSQNQFTGKQTFKIMTSDNTGFRQVVRDGFKPYQFQDQERKRVTHIVINFHVKQAERFSAYIFDIVKDWSTKKVSLS